MKVELQGRVASVAGSGTTGSAGHYELNEWARQEVAAHRQQQGIRKLMLETAQRACWIGRIQGALFVATAVFLWWIGGQL